MHLKKQSIASINKYQSHQIVPNILIATQLGQNIDDYNTAINIKAKGTVLCDPQYQTLLQGQNDKRLQNNIERQRQIIDEQQDLLDLWNEAEKEFQKQQNKNLIFQDQLKDNSMIPNNLLSNNLEYILSQQIMVKGKTEQNSLNQQPDKDLLDLWEQIQNQQNTIKMKSQIPSTIPIQQKEQIKPSVEKINILNKDFKIKQKDDIKGSLLVFSIDYHLVCKQKFVISPFRHDSYSYFGLKINKYAKENHYVLYSLQTNQELLYCSSQDLSSLTYLFILPQKQRKIGIMFETNIKRNQNNRIYEIKSYDSYQKDYGKREALISISDQFIGQFCYCSSSMILKSSRIDNKENCLEIQKQSKRFFMNINKKNGKLISNLHLQGILSSPYNCCLQDTNKNSCFLVGLLSEIDKTFVIKVGAPGSLLTSMGFAVSRIQYINSFKI